MSIDDINNSIKAVLTQIERVKGGILHFDPKFDIHNPAKGVNDKTIIKHGFYDKYGYFDKEKNIFSYKYPLQLNVPFFCCISGIPRVIICLDFPGIDEEMPFFVQSIQENTFKYRFSCYRDYRFPLLRFQITYYHPSIKPMDIDVAPDLSASDMQQFLWKLLESRVFEVVVQQGDSTHIRSHRITLSENEMQDLANDLLSTINSFGYLDPALQNNAVDQFEREHPLGEGMR